MSQTRRDESVQHTIVVKSGDDWQRFFLPYQRLSMDMTLLDESGRPLSTVGSRRVDFWWFSVGSSFMNTNSPVYLMDAPTLIGGWQLEGPLVDGLRFTVVERWPGPEIFRDGMRIKAYSLRIIPADEALAEPKAYTFPDVSKF